MCTENSHPDAKFIAQRQEGFANAFQRCDIDGILSYMADSVDFSDYASLDLHLNKAQVKDFFTRALGASKEISIKTLTVSGDRHFSTWEWALRFKLKSDDAEVKLLGISASWWDQEGKQMVRNHDYALSVNEFEWEKKGSEA